MEKLLKFVGKIGKFDDAIHIATENEPLVILLQVDTGRTVDYYATIKNETGKVFDIKVKDKKFEIPKELIVYGSMDITIVAKVKNETVNVFYCEQLIIKNVGGEKQVIPEIENLHIELQKTKDCFKQFTDEVNNQIQKMTQCIEALMEG